MSGYHDDRADPGYGPDGGYRSNRDVREAARGQRPPTGGQSRRDKDPACRVYVHNLDFRTSWQDLKDHMRGAGGDVEYVKIIQDQEGHSRGFGVCEFTNSRDAKEAIYKLDDTVLQGRHLGLRPDREASGDAGRNDSYRSSRGDSDYRSSRRDDDYRSSRRDDDYRNSRRDDSYRSRRDDDRSYRRERSPRRDSYRGDRDRPDEYRRENGDRGQRQSRGGKTAEELDAEMDALKEEKHAAEQ